MGISKSPLFATETEGIYSKYSWKYFLFRKNIFCRTCFVFSFVGGRKFFECRTVFLFFWREKFLCVSSAEKFYACHRTSVFFLLAGENSMRVLAGNTTLLT